MHVANESRFQRHPQYSVDFAMEGRSNRARMLERRVFAAAGCTLRKDARAIDFAGKDACPSPRENRRYAVRTGGLFVSPYSAR